MCPGLLKSNVVVGTACDGGYQGWVQVAACMGRLSNDDSNVKHCALHECWGAALRIAQDVPDVQAYHNVVVPASPPEAGCCNTDIVCWCETCSKSKPANWYYVHLLQMQIIAPVHVLPMAAEAMP